MKLYLVVSLILGSIASQVYSAPRQADTLRVIDTNSLPGDTVSVPVWLVNSFDVSGITFRIRFDPQVLNVLTVDTSGTRVSGIYTHFPAQIDNDSGVVIWSGIHFYDPFNNYIIPGSGVVAYLVFEVDSSSGVIQTPICFEDDSAHGYMNCLSDRWGNMVFPTLDHGLLRLTPVQADTLSVVNAHGYPGDTVAVPVELVNSFDVSGIQLRIKFNPQILNLLRVDTSGTRVSGIYTHFPTQIDNDSGFVVWIGINFYDPHNNYITPGSGVVAYLVFEVDTSSGPIQTPICFEDDSAHGYINNLSDRWGNMVFPMLENGVLELLPVGIDTLRVVDSSGYPGDTVEVPIWMVNSINISGIQFKIEYDPQRLYALRVDTVGTRVSGIYTHFPILIDNSAGYVLWYGLNFYDPYNNYIPPGSGPIAYVLFEVKPGGATEIPIVFEDSLTLLSGRTGHMIIPVLEDGLFEVLFTNREATTDIRLEFPNSFVIDRTFPNPFTQKITINYGIPNESENYRITMQIYDNSGRLVRRLLERSLHMPGWHTIQWNGRNDRGEQIPNGVYFCRMEANGCIVGLKKLILIK